MSAWFLMYALIPTSADLASGRDPVPADAAGLVGLKLTPEEAGKLFPVEWPVEWPSDGREHGK